MHLANMGLLLVFLFSDVGAATIRQTHRVESQWRTSEELERTNTISCLDRLCKHLFSALREMGYDKPICRPEYESYNNVINAMGEYIGEILAKLDGAKPSLSEYAPACMSYIQLHNHPKCK